MRPSSDQFIPHKAVLHDKEWCFDGSSFVFLVRLEPSHGDPSPTTRRWLRGLQHKLSWLEPHGIRSTRHMGKYGFGG